MVNKTFWIRHIKAKHFKKAIHKNPSKKIAKIYLDKKSFSVALKYYKNITNVTVIIFIILIANQNNHLKILF